MNTPYFLIKQSILQENIDSFKNALEKLWPNSILSYSVKTNSLPWIINYCREQGVYAEVVSEEEYCLAQLCGYKDSNIIYNGPIKKEEHIKKAIVGGCKYINLDSLRDLDALEKNKNILEFPVGLRLNIPPDIFDSGDIDYMEDGFRFGFSEENNGFGKAIIVFEKIFKNKKIGLHVHCNSVTRNISVYEAVARYVSFMIKKYKITPSYIDFGGGFFGGVENKPTAYQYISAIKSILEKSVNIAETKLIIEPGSAIVGSAIDLYTSVLDVKDTCKARIVTTDGSRINIDPLWKKKNYKFSIEKFSDKKEKISKQIICGYTCMDHDRLMYIKDGLELDIGDKIIYHRVGAYTVTFGGPFICYYPEVYVENQGSYELVREKMSVNEYYRIHFKNGGKL